MNAGVVAARYARALLKYATSVQAGERIYAQAEELFQQMLVVPALRNLIENQQEIVLEKKMTLLQTALGGKMESGLFRFVSLVAQHRRMELLSRILCSFIEQYRALHKIKVGTLVSATPMAGLKARLEQLMEAHTDTNVCLDEKIDPAILGGFILEMDGCRLDASVEHRLQQVRRQLIEKNNRIV